MHADIVRIHRVLKPYGRDRQADGAKGNERQVPQIDVAHAVHDARCAGAEPFALEAALVGKDGRETGEQHEYLGRVGEPKVAQREMRKPVVGDVIDEDEQQREPAEKIDLQVSIVGHARRAYWHASNPVPLQSERAIKAVPSQLQRDMLQQVPAATSLIGNGKRRCANRAQTTWKNRLEMGPAMNTR